MAEPTPSAGAPAPEKTLRLAGFDRDPVCGYNGVIGDVCPKCGRRESDELIKFERIRRITGYLVGTLDRFNDAKRAEERARVKHGLSTPPSP